MLSVVSASVGTIEQSNFSQTLCFCFLPTEIFHRDREATKTFP